MKVVFLGTPSFAVPTLERTLSAGHEVLEVITQPDRPKGRHHVPAPSPVKQFAVEAGLPVYQPERIRRPEVLEHLRALKPEIMVVVGYGQIIPQPVIDIPLHGIVNVHASLLPKYRGAAPVQWAIINGEPYTGVTTMRIDAGLDTGDILLVAKTDIGAEETSIELARRLALLGAGLLAETLQRIDSIRPQPQDSSAATYAPILKKQDGLIDWTASSAHIHNRIRGLVPWPGAYTTFRGQLLHLWRARVAGSNEIAPGPPGRIARSGGVFAACGGGSVLELLEVQLEGRKRVPAQAFANGHRFSENELLGAAPI
jgi:methionyl-tRNA formyltransferase